MLVDLSAATDVAIAESDKLVKAGKLTEALDVLLACEKQTRTSADLASNTRILLAIVNISFASKDWKGLGERITLLSKKHGLLKTAVTKMIQEAMSLLDRTPDKETKLQLIDTLRTVTDGKIFVEVERARLTRILAKIREDEGKISEAADILQELQVETFGSMDKREKTDFILEQMRLCLEKKDFTRVQIVSRRISSKFFEDLANQYLATCKYFIQLYNTPIVKEDDGRWPEFLRNAILFVILSPFDNEQSDLINRIYDDSNISKIGLFKWDFAKCFITHELVRWPKIEEIYGALLKATPAFDVSTEGGVARLKVLHQRIIEHNIRVIAKYYTRISMKRLTELLDLPDKETEEFLSTLVDPNKILNDWSSNINSLLHLINKTTHLIAKEEMVKDVKIVF
ncbi:hypothetical protein BC829DRAFT_424720 [Chytridium lagenaria]|nr:hypothetical protein BC829DRAFT_424720 [Chytridium lagenaria]